MHSFLLAPPRPPGAQQQPAATPVGNPGTGTGQAQGEGSVGTRQAEGEGGKGQALETGVDPGVLGAQQSEASHPIISPLLGAALEQRTLHSDVLEAEVRNPPGPTRVSSPAPSPTLSFMTPAPALNSVPDPTSSTAPASASAPVQASVTTSTPAATLTSIPAPAPSPTPAIILPLPFGSPPQAGIPSFTSAVVGAGTRAQSSRDGKEVSNGWGRGASLAQVCGDGTPQFLCPCVHTPCRT